jgi:hypothetical protein
VQYQIERRVKTDIFLKAEFIEPFAIHECCQPAGSLRRISERDFQRQLSDARSSHASHCAEAAKNIAGNAAELRVIENVEKFRPEFQIRFFCDQRVLVQREVPVVYAWTMEETTVRIAKHARDFWGEWGCVEPLPCFPYVHEVDWLAIVIGNICSSTTAQ